MTTKLPLSAFQLYLEGLPIELVLNSSPGEAIKKFCTEPQNYACAFVDHLLHNEFGEQEAIGHKVAEELKELNPALYAVMISGDDSKEALNTWLSSGIEKFVYKPLKEELIHTFIEHALNRFQERNPQTESKLINHYGLVGVSDHTKQIVKLIRKFAPSDETVLISGETGTGKELVAYS